MGEPEFIEAMQVLQLQPGDTLVIKTGRILPLDAHEQIRTHVTAIVGDVPVLILDKGMDVGALRQAA